MPTTATRRMSVAVGAGSSPCSTASARSTVTKSAKRGTATRASSSAVRTASRVVPTPSPASYSSSSRSRVTSALPDTACSSVESRSVTTVPRGPPARSVGRWLTASSRPPAKCTSSVASRPEVSSSTISGSRTDSSRTGRPSASRGSSSSRRASSLASNSCSSSSTMSTPSRTECSTVSWCSYIRVISAGARLWVWRRSRLPTSAVPPVDTKNAPAPAARMIGNCLSTSLVTFLTFRPAETRAITLPWLS